MPGQKDEVTDYLETVLKGLVKEKSGVSVEKKEYPDTKTVHYRFDVPDQEKPFFYKQVVLNGLDAITGHAAYILHPEYEKDNWQVSLKKWNDPF